MAAESPMPFVRPTDACSGVILPASYGPVGGVHPLRAFSAVRTRYSPVRSSESANPTRQGGVGYGAR
jgi:hypothetical protein